MTDWVRLSLIPLASVGSGFILLDSLGLITKKFKIKSVFRNNLNNFKKLNKIAIYITIVCSFAEIM